MNRLRFISKFINVTFILISSMFIASCELDSEGGSSYSSSRAVEYPDLRDRQHGIDLLKLNNGNYYLVWSSNANPPSAGWSHNIFYSNINPASPTISPVTWISATEAQEPASSAINASGTKILCTWEDGNNAENEIAQRYFISGATLGGTASTNYSNAKLFLDGGHSGHVAAVGDYFVSTWVEGWTNNDDGVDGLGSGNDVYVSVNDAAGTLTRNNVSVATGREWWSDVAGSSTKALVIWQSFVSGQQYANLKMMIYDPATGTKGSVQTIMNNVLYYHYSVRYIPAIDRFLIMASKDGGAGSNSGRLCSGGKAFLVDNSGTITASLNLTNGVIRESQSIVSGSRAAQTALKNGQSVFGNNSSGGALGGLTVLDLTASSIGVSQEINDSYAWEYMGNDGYFKDPSTVVVFALSQTGIATKTFTISTGTMFNITASAGANGTITPSGTVPVTQGADQTFTFAGNSGYVINAVTVDGVSQGAISSYTFTNVQAAHTINATFKVAPTTSFNITASAGANGTITPSGTVSVAQGSSQTFNIAGNSGYAVDTVTVDGTSQGAITSYTFTNVQAVHSISATFKVNSSGTPVLLSQGKTASASSNEDSSMNAAKAVDGSLTTRWSSVDPATTAQWLKVDLGSTKSIQKVVLNWEDAYAKSFTIQTSDNNSTWTNIYSTTTGTGGNATINNLSGNGRYVRIRCTVRGSAYGYSLWEFQVWGEGTPVSSYNITASAGANGTISPSGTVSVSQGASQTFTIAGNSGYVVNAVTVDGVSQGAINTYSFTNVQAAHTISATFKVSTTPTFNITASAGANGTISPSGTVAVTQGASQAFTIAGNSGYVVESVTVDGTPQGAINSYTFTNVQAAHSISATFKVGSTPIGGATSVCTWKDNKSAALTITYDDAIYNGLVTFQSYHTLYGLKGTIGVVPAWSDTGMHAEGYPVATWTQLQTFINTGTFDVCSHGDTHAQGTTLSAADLDAEYLNSQNHIKAKLVYKGTTTPVMPRTLLYPYYDFTSLMGTEAAKYFIAARGGDGEVDLNNKARPNLITGTHTVYYDQFAYSFYDDTPVAELKTTLDQHILNMAWMIVAIHSTKEDDPASYSAPARATIKDNFAYFSSKLNVVWNGFYEEVAKYHRERQKATVSVITSTSSQIQVSLTDTLDNAIYNFPLTLKTEVPSTWVGASATQGTSTKTYTAVTESGKKYVYYDAIPDGGLLTLLAQ